MEILKELVHILTLNKTKKIRQYGFLQDETGRLLQFYQGLVKDKWNDDEAAAQEILGLNAKHKTYRRLKNNLREELLDALLFIEDAGENDFQITFYNNYKKWAQIAFLRHQQAKSAAFSLAKKVLKKAIEYDMTVLILEISRQLRRSNAAYIGNEKDHKYYSDLIEEYLWVYQLEIEAEGIYTSSGLAYARSKSTKVSLFQEFYPYYKKINSHFGKVKSFNYHLYISLIGINLFMSKNDFGETRLICISSIDYFEQKGIRYKAFIYIFIYQLIVCEIQLKDFPAAQQSIEKCYALTKKGTHYYFRTLENHLLLSFYTQEYQQAYDILQTTKKTKGFKLLLPLVKERWILHEAYVQFLVAIGKVKVSTNQNKKFKIQKFLNDIPTFTQDKRGMNIPVLLLQVLFLWHRREFDKAFQRIENLKKYNTRYLRKDDTMRTTYFIKMLTVAANEGFAPRATKKAALPLYEQLTSRDIVFANQSAELEYIPYEDLWEIGIEILEKRLIN